MVSATGFEPDKNCVNGSDSSPDGRYGSSGILHTPPQTPRLAPAWHRRVPKLLAPSYLKRRVFCIMLLGCFENCLPAFFALRLALVVAAYSAGDRASIAAAGKYRSPVSLDFLPDLVRQSCLPHCFKLCCGLCISFYILHPQPYNAWPEPELFELTIYRPLCHARLLPE